MSVFRNLMILDEVENSYNSEKYLVIECPEANGLIVGFAQNYFDGIFHFSDNWSNTVFNGGVLEYSTDGENWEFWGPIILNETNYKGFETNKIYLRGKFPNGFYLGSGYSYGGEYNLHSCTGLYAVGYIDLYNLSVANLKGNLLSLLDYENENLTVPPFAFAGFLGETFNALDCTNLYIPAKTVSEGSFFQFLNWNLTENSPKFSAEDCVEDINDFIYFTKIPPFWGACGADSYNSITEVYANIKNPILMLGMFPPNTNNIYIPKEVSKEQVQEIYYQSTGKSILLDHILEYK